MPARGHERFTVLVIPHSARPTAALRLSSRAIQILCAALILVFFSLTVFAARYAQLASYMHELRDLRVLTVAQEEQLKLLQGAAAELRDRLEDLAQLDRELRQLLGLAPPATPIEDLLAVSKSVTIARGPSTSPGGSSPAVSTLAVETSLMSKAGYLADSFAVLREEMEGRVASLEDLRVAAAEQLAYEAARPSIWPTNGYITSGYGYRIAPIGGYRQLHPAVDIAAPVGTPVVATGDGRVVFSGWKHDLGNTVMVDHGYDFRTLYAHVARVVVAVGDRVKKGQVIAYVGSTGRSTGPHLHYEVHLRGKETNPRPYLR